MVVMHQLWSPEEDAVLRAEYGATKRRKLAAKLGRTPAAVTLRASRIGIADAAKRPAHTSVRYADWTSDEALAEFERFKKSRKSVARYCATKSYDRNAWSYAMRRHILEDDWEAATEHQWPDSRLYIRGAALEREVVAHLEGLGWHAVRTKRSLTVADVTAFNRNVKVIVQCKLDGLIGSVAEWNAVVDFARAQHAVPLLAGKPGKGLRFWRLDGHKVPGRDQWVWMPQPYTAIVLTPDGIEETEPHQRVRKPRPAPVYFDFDSGPFEDPVLGIDVTTAV
jgi:Holliday junction resolvase